MAAAGNGSAGLDTRGRYKTEAQAVEAVELLLRAARTSMRAIAVGRPHCTARRAGAGTAW